MAQPECVHCGSLMVSYVNHGWDCPKCGEFGDDAAKKYQKNMVLSEEALIRNNSEGEV